MAAANRFRLEPVAAQMTPSKNLRISRFSQSFANDVIEKMIAQQPALAATMEGRMRQDAADGLRNLADQIAAAEGIDDSKNIVHRLQRVHQQTRAITFFYEHTLLEDERSPAYRKAERGAAMTRETIRLDDNDDEMRVD